ncbi:bZIP transcription factor [Pyrenophora tritici-repentis]|nr:bZIP transcription factor [Pyrenophora tritici-repentis]KAI1681105.1 bZIP transcription factor [Pyrenophora tritici-repentis]
MGWGSQERSSITNRELPPTPPHQPRASLLVINSIVDNPAFHRIHIINQASKSRDMTSSESEEQTQPSRKRSRRSNSGEDGGALGKKARGRPRVDTQDATAADRRRTQIRLAQRAYRQRKETTIASLKNQNTQLQSIIDQMNKTFLRVNDATLKSGLLQLNPNLVQEFKLATDTFSSLIKTTSEGQYEGEEDAEPSQKIPDGVVAQVPPQPEPVTQDIGWGYSAISGPVAKDNSQQAHLGQSPTDGYFSNIVPVYDQSDSGTSGVVRRRQFTVSDVLSHSRRSSYAPSNSSPSHSTPQSVQLPFGLVDLLSQQQQPYTPHNVNVYSVDIPTPDVTPPTTRLPTPPLSVPKISTKSLPAVTTYSFEERTFARRLSRTALEAGFHLLSNAKSVTPIINHIFKFSLPYMTLDQIRERFRRTILRTIDEDLDWWDSPFLHVGGAGTHYPRRDPAGNIVPIKNAWTVRQIGPLEMKVALMEHTEDGRSEELNGVDLRGYEGEWFDTHDVQGYLEDYYSCKIDPKSSYAECFIDDNDDQVDQHTTRPLVNERAPPLSQLSSTSSTGSTTTAMTPPNNPYNLSWTGPYSLDMPFGNATTPNYPNNFPKLVNYTSSFKTLGMDLAPGFDYAFASGNTFPMGGMDMGLGLMSGNVESLPVVRQKKKKSAWVDVSRLVEEINNCAVCLGRAPGYRRKDVDRAILKSLI